MWPFKRKPKPRPIHWRPTAEEWAVGDKAQCVSGWPYIPDVACPTRGRAYTVIEVREGEFCNFPGIGGVALCLRGLTYGIGYDANSFVKIRPADEGFKALMAKVTRRGRAKEDA